MSISVFEKFGSRESTEGADSSSVERLYVLTGSDDDLALKAALIIEAGDLYDGLPRQTAKVTQLGPLLWDGAVQFGDPTKEKPETGESVISFDTTGGSQHITQSFGTTRFDKSEGDPGPDFKSAINVHGDNVEGVDIVIPQLKFQETHYLPLATVTLAYINTLYSLTGKTNSGVWRGFAAGELLFLGASGSRRGTKDWEVTYAFAASENVTGLNMGDVLGIAKSGHQYIWVYYRDEEDSTANVLVKRPHAAYVETVYQAANFTALGIGA